MAAQNNVLIVRIEDLLRLWDALRNNKLTSQDIFNLITSNKGWLRVDTSLAVRVMK